MVTPERDNGEAERRAARQHGLVTRAQALECGLTAEQIKYRVECGRWTAVRPGVYGVVGVPPTWEHAVLAAVLAGAHPIVASHWSAARLLGTRVPPGIEVIEVSGPLPYWSRMPGVRGHRSMHLFDADRTVRQGIPCTTAARLVVDLSTRVDERELGRISDDLQRRRLLKLVDLGRCVGRLPPAPGRSPATVRRLLAARWEGYDPGDSDLETRMLRAIATAGLPLPRQQFRVEVQGRRRYIDFAYPEHKLAIEVQGDVHTMRSRYEDDRIRINELVLLGWRPLEITCAMTDAALVGQIGRALEAFAP